MVYCVLTREVAKNDLMLYSNLLRGTDMRANLVAVMNFRVPTGFLSAIAKAAGRERISQSEFARRAILERIAAAGGDQAIPLRNEQEGKA